MAEFRGCNTYTGDPNHLLTGMNLEVCCKHPKKRWHFFHANSTWRIIPWRMQVANNYGQFSCPKLDSSSYNWLK